MSTLKDPKVKTAKRFRVKIGNDYAKLDFNFHEKGILVRDLDGPMSSTIFRRNVDAGHAMQRTAKLQQEVRESMHRDWHVFKPLLYPETPTVEEFDEIVSLEE